MKKGSVSNQKGGTGKTTTTVNLGAALARAGKRTLLVDMDPQASLTEYFTDPNAFQTTIYNALLDGQTVRPFQIGELISLLPANIDLADAELQLLKKHFAEQKLASVLNTFETQYDFCLIDCPPSLGMLTANALTAADFVIVPVTTELMAERTIKLITDTVDEIKEGNEGLHIWHILPTIYDQRLAHHREILEALKVKYPNLTYPEPVRSTTKYKDAVVEKADAGFLDSKIADYWDTLAHQLIERYGE